MATITDLNDAISKAWAYALELGDELYAEQQNGCIDCFDASKIECLLQLGETLQYYINTGNIGSITDDLYLRLLDATDDYTGSGMDYDPNAYVPNTNIIVLDGTGVWGYITGNIQDQTDLVQLLNGLGEGYAKLNGGNTFTGNQVTTSKFIAKNNSIRSNIAFELHKRGDDPVTSQPTFRFVTYDLLNDDLFIEHRFNNGTSNAPFQLRHSDGVILINGIRPIDSFLDLQGNPQDNVLLGQALNSKVDKITGKGLSTNDYTSVEKAKLEGIEEGATQNEDDTFLLNRANHTGVQSIGTVSGLQTSLDSKIPLSQKGVQNGVATLDSGGKVPASQLPVGSQVYKGTWDASTNTPVLADGSGQAGDTYRVAVGGTRNLGSGNITFIAGDDVIYNGTIWQRNPSSQTVVSVNGKQGVVVIDKSDVNLGLADNTPDSDKEVSIPQQTALNLKIDKVLGKQLSTNDYTDAEKAIVSNTSGTNTGDQDLSGLATVTDLNTEVTNRQAADNLLQPKIDNTLTTADKTVVGAINEIDCLVIPETFIKYFNGSDIVQALSYSPITSEVCQVCINEGKPLSPNISYTLVENILTIKKEAIALVPTTGFSMPIQIDIGYKFKNI